MVRTVYIRGKDFHVQNKHQKYVEETPIVDSQITGLGEAAQKRWGMSTLLHHVSIPDASIPAASIPDASIPDASIPDPSIPDASIPDASIPDPSIPDTSIPDTSIPDASIPDLQKRRYKEQALTENRHTLSRLPT